MVRFGSGYTFFRMRIASIMTMVPVPLSVAPVAPSQESKWADSMTYSFGFSFPLISARVLKVGTSPSSFDWVSMLIMGALPDSVSRYTSP